MNTVLTNEITGASLSSNAITLPAGKYYIEASAPAYEVERHMVRLYNTTDSSLVISGTSEFTNTSNQISNRSFVSGRFLITAEKAFEIQHQCQTTRATSGFGVDSNTAFTVDHETYTDVKIWQIA
ncbi:MAG: hypothetical protein GWN13_02865 [Phycisphaerae bacterium]|nr:hypothetical protein [Phycisphaerae bacterium]